MDFFTTELREKPIIGMISGVSAWIIQQINVSQTTGFFSDINPFWDVVSKFGILMGSLIAIITFVLKTKELINSFKKDN